MAPYARTRSRRRFRRRGRVRGREVGAAVAAGIILAATAHSGHPHRHAPSAATAAARRDAVAAAVGYARAQLGKPYLWGGTGPGAFDCSGLVMTAYRHAGIRLPRTTWQQWATGPRVAHPRPGDLVFFAGSDGTSGAPGHVGLVTGRHTMIEAYAAGYPVRVASFATPWSPPGDGDPVGYTWPAAAAR